MNGYPSANVGISAALACARLTAVFGPCAHDAVPVELLDTGEIVAWLCTACGTQLPADWQVSIVDTSADPRLIGWAAS